jgi:hypothetical protein
MHVYRSLQKFTEVYRSFLKTTTQTLRKNMSKQSKEKCKASQGEEDKTKVIPNSGCGFHK